MRSARNAVTAMKNFFSVFTIYITLIASVCSVEISSVRQPPSTDAIKFEKVDLPNSKAWMKIIGSSEVITDKFKRRETVSIKETESPKTIKPLEKSSTAQTFIQKITHDHLEDQMPPFVDQLPQGPFFDFERSRNVTSLVGSSAKLNCRVNQIGNRTVSWLRDRDTHLLTVGRYTYTSDQRFRAEHISGSEDWPLTVKFAQVRDSGIYECQVSTTPPIRHYIWLNIVEPRTQILGGPDFYIDRGSSINLTCVVDYTPQPPLYVIWKHSNRIISYDSDRGGVSVVTEKGPQTSTNLLIRNASEGDSGVYSCNPSSAPFSSVTVHILNGEHPAAMQHGGHSPNHLSHLVASFTFFTLMMLH